MQKGFSLLELIVVIVVLGILVTGFLKVMPASLQNQPTAQNILTASFLAEQRLELIRTQKQVLGFANFNATNYDPCLLASPPSLCTPPTGYTVVSSFIDN